MLENISVDKLKNINDGEIIDIRSLKKYNDNHILNARNIPYEQLLIYHHNYINKHTKYYIYCQRGSKSKQICSVLKNMGYNVVNIIGGYDSWLLNN